MTRDKTPYECPDMTMIDYEEVHPAECSECARLHEENAELKAASNREAHITALNASRTAREQFEAVAAAKEAGAREVLTILAYQEYGGGASGEKSRQDYIEYLLNIWKEKQQ